MVTGDLLDGDELPNSSLDGPDGWGASKKRILQGGQHGWELMIDEDSALG
jgi:hypothetical protein